MKKSLAVISALVLLLAVFSVCGTALADTATDQRVITLNSSILAEGSGSGTQSDPVKVQAGTSQIAMTVTNLAQKDWVALYAADHELNAWGSGYYDYIYPSGNSGSTSFPSNNTGRNTLMPQWPLANGSYKLVLFKNDGYEIGATLYFDVVGTVTTTTTTADPNAVSMTANKTEINAGETITLTMKNVPEGMEFGVFPGNAAGSITAYSPSNYQALAAGTTSKQVTINNSGNFVIALWTSGWNFQVLIPVKVNAVTPVGDPTMTVKDNTVYVGDPLEFELTNIGSGLSFGLLKGDANGNIVAPYEWVGYTTLAPDTKTHTYLPTAVSGNYVAAVWGSGWDFKVKVPVVITPQPTAESVKEMYVSADFGDDNNEGTEAAPKKTLAAAIAALGGHGTVYVRDEATYTADITAYAGTVTIKGMAGDSHLTFADGAVLKGDTVLSKLNLLDDVINAGTYKLTVAEDMSGTVTLVVKNADNSVATLKNVPLKGLTVGKNADGKVTVAVNGNADKLWVAGNEDGKTVIVGGNEFVNDDVTVPNYQFDTYKDYINYRNPLTNTYHKIAKDEEITVLYFGGSVTAGYGGNIGGWRSQTMNWFKGTFPNTTFNFVNTAVGESGTFLGTYRLEQDVLSKNPDLIFIEYAINDTYKGSSQAVAALQYETVIRELKTALPDCDIITILVTDRERAKQLPDLYPTAAGHEAVAQKYGISTINVGAALVDSMTNPNDNNEWYHYFLDTVHPNNNGYYAYYKVIAEYLRNCLLYTKHPDAMANADVLLPVQSDNLLGGDRLTAFGEAMQDAVVSGSTSGFTFSTNNFVNHGDIAHPGYYVATSLDAKITFKFTGTEFAFYTNFYDTSKIKYSIDGGTFTEMNCHRHAPTQVITGLTSGNHTITIQPVSMGSEANGEFRIGAIFTRDAAKQTVKDTVTTYTDCNRVTFTLPAGEWTLTAMNITDTVAQVATPTLANGETFNGWKDASGATVANTKVLASGMVLNAAVSGTAISTTTTTTTTTTQAAVTTTTQAAAATTTTTAATTTTTAATTTTTAVTTTQAAVTTTTQAATTTTVAATTTQAAATTTQAAVTTTTTAAQQPETPDTGVVVAVPMALLVLTAGAGVALASLKRKQ